MDSNEQSNSRALLFLLDALKEVESNEILIGEQEKKLAQLKNKNQDSIRTACIMAVNYFTAEKNTELHEKSISLLGCDDFDANEYIHIFSDISKLELHHIEFLLQRKEEIDSIQEKLNSNVDSISSKKKFPMNLLADILMRE